MSRRSTALLKTALAAVHYSGAGNLLAPYTRGAGVIFMLHHVDPTPPQPFEPNRILKVTPDFLDDVLREVIDAGFDIIPLDQVRERLENADSEQAVRLLHARRRLSRQPRSRLSRLRAPRRAFHHLRAERLRRRQRRLLVAHVREGAARRAADHPLHERRDAPLPPVDAGREGCRLPRDLLVAARAPRGAGARRRRRAGRASTTSTRPPSHAGLVMSWDELRELAKDPLVTIGAHTRGHHALAKLSDDEARAEMADSIARVEKELGRPCRHFSYPYGCAQQRRPTRVPARRGAGSRDRRHDAKGAALSPSMRTS